MQSMYAKLFSRIAQSSLMEQDVETRYCFMMLLAIADMAGDVIGTDVAIARTVNLPVVTFKRCIEVLMSPDPDSNSQAYEGRRVIPSENGRGYNLVNYTTYRAIKTAEEKRAYMREYMQKRRNSERSVKRVNHCKDQLGDVTHADAEGETEVEETPAAGVVPEKVKQTSGAGSPAFPDDLPEDYRKALTLWWTHKKERGQGYKATGWSTLIKQQRLKPIADLVRDIEASIASNYAGIFAAPNPQSGQRQSVTFRPSGHHRNSCL